MLPYLDCPILASRSNAAAVWAPVQRVNLIGVTGQRLFSPLPLGHLPKLGCAILARTDQESRVRAPRHLVDRTHMSGEGSDEIGRSPIPYLDLPIERGRSEVSSVGGEGDVID